MSERLARTVLLVDDDTTFRDRLARALRERGYEVRTAAEHDEALQVATEDPPELAVVDLRLPGRSGLEVVRALLRIDPATRVVVLTGYGSIATAVDAMRLGAVHYLPKPADAEDIEDAFRRADLPPLHEVGGEHLAPSLARAEWEHIQRVLQDCAGNISEAARRLNIHRRSLQRKLSKFPPGS